jgi:predicted DCC family thiol-disulfide oxidoreductase YuxK
MKTGLIVFDMDCLVCNRFVEWVDKRNVYYLYASLGTIDAINRHLSTNIENLNKIVVLEKGAVYYGAVAIKQIIKKVYPNTVIIKFFELLPEVIIEKCYDIFARNRFIFGTKKQCEISLSISEKIVLIYYILS